MKHNPYIYILLMFAVTFAIRVIPFTLLKKKITNKFFRSFMYYVPYATLSVMTFPAIVDSTQSPVAGALAMAVGIIAAWRGVSMFKVAVICCCVVFASEFLITLL